jgi:LPXTG-motif cell wall-anchored protein
MSQSEEGNVQTDNDADKYGYTNGAITISYEDEFGNPYSVEIPFDMQIEPPVISASAPEEEEEPVDTASQWWISVIIGAALIAAVAAVLVVRRKRKLKALGDGDGLD